jgi:hypothetical protein
VKGTVVDASGIYSVSINDVEAQVSSSGEFWANVALAYGDNNITVTATDTKKNSTKETFTIARETAITPPPTPTPVATSTQTGSNYALLFATDDYLNWGDLVNPVKDAEAIAKELRDNYGFQTEVCKNLSQEAVLTKLRSYAIKSFGDNDQLLIFFAGHGVFDEVTKMGYVVPRDAKANDVSKISCISHSNLRDYVNNIPCKHILLTMDVCFGGTIDPKATRSIEDYSDIPQPEFIARKLKYKTRQYLTSGGKEYVPDGRPGYHSPFARKFLEALRSYGGSDGVLTIGEICGYLERVTPEPRRGEFGDNEPGSDFIFIAK